MVANGDEPNYRVRMLQTVSTSDESTLPTIGTRLAAARLARGLTQKAVAEKLGVDDKTYRRWELDQIAVKPKYHDDLCRVLKMSLSDFNPY